MELIFSAIVESDIAQYLRFSRWTYALVNGLHILGISLLIGSIIPLDLRLLGAWSGISRTSLVQVLAPTAAVGLILAIVTGFLLFSIRADEYPYIKIFQIKIALITLGVCSSLTAHLRFGLWLERGTEKGLAIAALISMFCWLGALSAGRLIAFVSN